MGKKQTERHNAVDSHIIKPASPAFQAALTKPVQ